MRWLALTLVLMHQAVAPHAARAQGLFHVRPLFSMAHMHDTNVFVTTSNRQADFITRVSPGIESEYRSQRLTLLGRYRLDADRFANHTALTSVNGQRGALTITLHPRRGMELASGAELAKTHTPGEFSVETGLLLGRAAARRVTAHSKITQRFGKRTSGTIDYRYTDDRLAGAFGVRNHAAGLGTTHHASSRDTVTFGYRVHQFTFDGQDASASATSHALNLGWTRALTRETSLSVHAGPRVDSGSLAPELFASISHRHSPFQLSLSYSRRQTTILGLPGAADTQSVTASAGLSLSRRWQLHAAPGIFQSAHPLLNEIVYRLGIGVARSITSNLSMDAALDLYVQPASQYVTLTRGRLTRQAMLIRLVAQPAVRH